VHERPGLRDSDSLTTPAKTTTVNFDLGYYISGNGWKPLLRSASEEKVYQILMVNNADTKIIASPSWPDGARDGFRVAYGSTSPAP